MGDLLAAFAEWRDVDANDAQAVVQIFSKPAFDNPLFQIRVGGGDDADIYALRTGFTAGMISPARGPQELGLESSVTSPILEKQRALAACGSARLICDRPGKLPRTWPHADCRNSRVVSCTEGEDMA